MQADTEAEEFWKQYDLNPWLTRLARQGVRVVAATRLEDGTWSVNLSETKVTDLSPLTGMPLESLSLSKVNDISVLRGMPLTQLNLSECSATMDLSPFADSHTLTAMILSSPGMDLDNKILPQPVSTHLTDFLAATRTSVFF